MFCGYYDHYCIIHCIVESTIAQATYYVYAICYGGVSTDKHCLLPTIRRPV